MASIRTLKKLPEKLEDISSNGQKFRRFELMSVQTNVLTPKFNALCHDMSPLALKLLVLEPNKNIENHLSQNFAI